MKMDGRVAVVTGGARWIGKSTARLFATESKGSREWSLNE